MPRSFMSLPMVASDIARPRCDGNTSESGAPSESARAASRTATAAAESGNPVRAAGLHAIGRNGPGSGLEIDFLPSGAPDFAGASCGQRDEFEGEPGRRPCLALPDGGERRPDFAMREGAPGERHSSGAPPARPRSECRADVHRPRPTGAPRRCVEAPAAAPSLALVVPNRPHHREHGMRGNVGYRLAHQRHRVGVEARPPLFFRLAAVAPVGPLQREHRFDALGEGGGGTCRPARSAVGSTPRRASL